MHSIIECGLNVPNGNIALTGCDTSKLLKHMLSLRMLVDKQLPLSAKKQLIVQCGGFLLPLLAAVLPKLATLIAAK